MIIISHRGNINGSIQCEENNPTIIEKRISQYENFEFELDVWFVHNRWYLGHDEPKYNVNIDFVKNNKIWCHCKNFEAINELYKMGNIIYFWHEQDQYTLTSNNYIWTFPYENCSYSERSILVLPENMKNINLENSNIYAICTDFPLKYL